jgi:plastocyanin
MKNRSTTAGCLVGALVFALTANAVLAAGQLKATVKKDGERPKRTVVQMDADPNCVKANTGDDGKAKKVGSQEAVVSKDGQVMNAVVYVKDGLGDATFPVPEKQVEIDQQGCMYHPHVLSVQVDQTIIVRNSDDTLHNIHSFAEKQRAFNFAQPQKGMTREVTFKQPEFVKVKCDVHPWMSAYVAVFTHPFHTVTDKDGVGSIADLPPGEYTIGVWHEEFGEKEQKVTIAEGQTAEIEFSYE